MWSNLSWLHYISWSSFSGLQLMSEATRSSMQTPSWPGRSLRGCLIWQPTSRCAGSTVQKELSRTSMIRSVYLLMGVSSGWGCYGYHCVNPLMEEVTRKSWKLWFLIPISPSVIKEYQNLPDWKSWNIVVCISDTITLWNARYSYLLRFFQWQFEMRVTDIMFSLLICSNLSRSSQKLMWLKLGSNTLILCKKHEV